MSSTVATAGVGPFSPSTVGGTGTTAKIFPSLINGAAPAILAISSSQLGGQMKILISGSLYVAGTSPTVNFILQSGTSMTPGSNTTIATLGTVASLTTSAAYPFAFTCSAQGDSASGIQLYAPTFYCAGTSGTVTLTQGLTADTFSGSGPAASLVVGVVFGVSNTSNFANLEQFQLES